MRTIRLFKILDIMRGMTRPISAGEIGEQMGVTKRTIYRDMATLLSIGAPIRGEAGVGYQLEPGYFLPPLHFDEDELDVLILGLEMVKTRSDPETCSAADRVLGKLDTMVSANTQTRDRPLLAVGRSGGAFQPDYIGVLRRAIRSRNTISIRYIDKSNTVSNRIIRPLGLTAFESVWLLTAWCETRVTFRDFRVDRIQSLDVSELKFRHENGKRFSDYIRSL